MARTLIVSNRLPVYLIKDENHYSYTRSSGGLATSLASVYKGSDSIWVGWPGVDVPSAEQQNIVSEELAKSKMIPVFIEKEDLDHYYEGFSNDTIWPLFHYFPRLTNFDQKNWQAYQKVNHQFCEEIMKIAGEDDTIWIHDYHLFLLPDMLRKMMPKATIGFFLHIPFPSYETFRILPWREAILEGLVGADQIGFQTYDDTRHFLSSVSRILSIPNSDGKLEIANRTIRVDSFPISIDYQLYENASMLPEVIEKVKEFRKTFGDNKLILSIDRLDLSKGIPEKLRAYERYLENCPELKGSHNLILLVVPSRVEVENYRNLKWEIEHEVGRINGRFGRLSWTPIRYMFTSLPMESVSALYKVADMALVTPLRDGMNLVAKEFLASKTDGTGVLVLSEMAGAAKELSDAIVVNPFDCNQVAEAIQTALEMPIDEQIKRNRLMQEQLKRNDVHRWANTFLTRLAEVKLKQAQHAEKKLNSLLTTTIIHSFRTSRQRIMFLDYDGTLMPFFKEPRQAKPDQELLELMHKL